VCTQEGDHLLQVRVNKENLLESLLISVVTYTQMHAYYYLPTLIILQVSFESQCPAYLKLLHHKSKSKSSQIISYYGLSSLPAIL